MFDAEKALSKAKVGIMMKENTAFISSVMMSLSFHWDQNIPTACTNGLEIRINPAFFEKLPPKQRVFLLLHETWHVAFQHIPRCFDFSYDPEKWNYATDYAINIMLVDEGHEFIEGGLLDSQFRGMSADEIYKLLPEPPQMPQNILAGDMQQPGGNPSDDQNSGSQPTMDEIKVKTQEVLARATMQADMAQQAGSVPADIRRAVEEARNPKLPWNVVLEQYMSERIQDEYSWNKRNRRFSHVYLPGMDSEGMGEIRCYLDASGSVSQKELDLQVAEMKYIKEVSNPSLMALHAFSTVLGREQRFERDEEIEFDVDAGGGTCVRPIMADLAAHPDTEVAVIFTDGYFSMPDTSHLTCDLVWVIVNNESWTTDTGRVIHMAIKD